MNMTLAQSTKSLRFGASLGDETRERLLAAALKHFAIEGYEGASLRAIQSDANANTAAVHYHFGSKQALYAAVVETRLAPILAKRKSLLPAAAAVPDPRLRLEALVRAYVRPHLELSRDGDGVHYARLLARMLVEFKPRLQQTFGDLVEPVRGEYLEALRALFPGASYEQLARSIAFTVSLMACAPFDPNYRSMAGREPMSGDIEDEIAVVTAFATAGFIGLCGPLVSAAKRGRARD
jgi:TetR/AcrR family transcriptional regulator, regulator of cefoperazone and chloramphenicol sensitivity